MSSTKSILILEDNIDSRELFGEILRDENYVVIETEDGQDALNYLRTHETPPDLILMDLTFPHMSASQFVDELLAEAKWQDIPLIVVSGQVDTQEQAIKLNAKGFLKKPFDINQFVRTIREVSF